MRRVLFLATTLIFVISQNANATLIDRGNGLIYDDALDITWLQDANYAQTSGYDDDGAMTWTEANNWAAQLVFGGYDDWRLTSVGDNPSDHGGNTGYNMITGELGYMYYINLGNESDEYSTGCNPNCFANTSFIDLDTGLTASFENVVSYHYWYSETNPNPPNEAWTFITLDGSQRSIGKTNRVYSWAVRDGDVTAVTVSEPSTILLLLLGALGLIKRKNFL